MMGQMAGTRQVQLRRLGPGHTRGGVTGSAVMAALEPPFAERSTTDVVDRLQHRRLIVLSGKGGVGRTTMAAMFGLGIAERGRKVLVATTGHDDRLAWMLGADRLDTTPRAVAPGLYIQRLEPQHCIREYGGLVLRSQRMSSAVFDNRVIRKLLRAIPGLDDFAVMGKAWHEAERGTEFDTVVFDGPATGHLLYTLEVPQAILSAIPKGPLTKEAEYIQSCLQDPSRVEAVLVGLPERWPLTELSELGSALRHRVRMSVATIIVNGLWPTGLPRLCGDGPLANAIEIGEQQQQAIVDWSSAAGTQTVAGAGVLRLPWRWGGISGPSDLRELLGAEVHSPASLQQGGQS